MPVVLVAEETITVGKPVLLEASAPGGAFSVRFEDDGNTGYFYGLELANSEQPIVDALHIYNVDDVVDKDTPSHVRLGWSTDGLKAVCDINGHPHAIFDFSAKRGYCRTGFPPPPENWSTQGHDWDDAALDLFD